MLDFPRLLSLTIINTFKNFINYLISKISVFLKIKSFQILFFLFLSVIYLDTNEVFALEFRYYTQPEEKLRIIIAEGMIAYRDNLKFAKYAKNADRDTHGNIILVLNSPGGNVDAAFEMADSMDKIGVTTIVPDNAVCASACASILYVSGRLRGVLGSGVIGFHSCYTTDSRHQIIDSRNDQCNDRIGLNALAHGIDYGLVDAWTYDYGPSKMAYMDAKLACHIGLCSKAIVPGARTPDEFKDEMFRRFNSERKK